MIEALNIDHDPTSNPCKNKTDGHDCMYPNCQVVPNLQEDDIQNLNIEELENNDIIDKTIQASTHLGGFAHLRAAGIEPVGKT
jgi:hypothetical protein